jgi:hypothetical protein
MRQAIPYVSRRGCAPYSPSVKVAVVLPIAITDHLGSSSF